MDAVASLAFELQPAEPALAGAGSAGAANSASVFEVSHFDAAFAAAANTAPAAAHTMHVSASESQGFRTVMATLDNLNGRAESLGSKALQMQHGEFRPSDMLMMTLKAQEFLFHCELTSNVANRTSEGVQQLFREQT
ncbi:MAG TPA: hypothetical protein VGO18_34660 [Steroidobacteraceae bacterium]|jgi:hypothetical protein|nr:hypothetical protein [Steroidobacteraceae bacterium]